MSHFARVEISIKPYGTTRAQRVIFLLPDDLLTSPVSQGNDHRQDAAQALVNAKLWELYHRMFGKKRS